MKKCYAQQFSDTMVCRCGNVWDTNDPYPPECKKQEGEAEGMTDKTDREIMQQSLEVLVQHVKHYDYEQFTSVCELEPAKDLILVLCERLAQPDPLQRLTDVQQEIEAALAQPAQPAQEPVAGVVIREGLPTLLQDKHIKSTDQRLYTAPPEQEPVVCIVKGCSNHRGEGRFIGALCSPCHTFITTGEGKHSQAYRNSQREWQKLTENEMKKLADTHLKYQPESYEVSGVFDLIRAVEAKLKEKND